MVRRFANIPSVRRVLAIAVLDALGLDNTIAKSKVLVGAAGAAAKLLEAEREEGHGWEGEADEGRVPEAKLSAWRSRPPGPRAATSPQRSDAHGPQSYH